MYTHIYAYIYLTLMLKIMNESKDLTKLTDIQCSWIEKIRSKDINFLQIVLWV
jgi:hypothetical protein